MLYGVYKYQSQNVFTKNMQKPQPLKTFQIINSYMAQVAERSRFKEWVRQEPWRESARATFRSFATMRESARRGGLNIDESVAFCKGPVAEEFAGKVVSGLETAAARDYIAGCTNFSICELDPRVVQGLDRPYWGGADNSDAFVFGSANSFVLGLVRADGLVTPVVFNDRAVLVQKGYGPTATLYDGSTDFARLLRDNLTPRSFV